MRRAPTLWQAFKVLVMPPGWAPDPTPPATRPALASARAQLYAGSQLLIAATLSFLLLSAGSRPFWQSLVAVALILWALGDSGRILDGGPIRAGRETVRLGLTSAMVVLVLHRA
jgi:hypothetical protein